MPMKTVSINIIANALEEDERYTKRLVHSGNVKLFTYLFHMQV